ncbi:glycosyltransferase family 4 protein [Pseudonocardia broussonetiae]|uniref:Glycosyltransferase family 4 protein n=1 Tax=Pseudonocardia broussonetiae TaxID=2736640 RepID=A0A6M6JS29_9PSEU|nr:glycosyltransferase family 4 protein [Pseudonocardia broussonetiae]QJY49041.1 glycosyltransferase family 4 protein [Pseudonocardia broussonetiae]
MSAPHRSPVAALDGRHILVLNWRDVRHPQAGGAELYMHRIATRWVAAGARVTWLAAQPEGASCSEVVDGVEVHRAGGALTLYPRTALRLLGRRFRDVDHVVDCQNGIPFFSPLFVATGVPIVQLVHHVHQDQFATRFGPVLAAVGRFLEGRAARRVYGLRPIAAVSPSTRQELRRRLRFRSAISVVPNGTAPVPDVRGPRDPDPTLAVVSRLVPHKRIDLLLEQLVAVAAAVPGLRVDVVGDGPELPRLRAMADELGLGGTVTFHGYQPDAVRDEVLGRAWLTTVTSAAEGWGCSVVEAAGLGVPTVAVRVPGIRDSVVDGSTGWLVDDERELGEAMIRALRLLADESAAERVTDACQTWARCFTWDRSAGLLAAVLVQAADGTPAPGDRSARSDITTVARFRRPAGWTGAGLRVTDEARDDGEVVSLLLHGCDEVDAAGTLQRLGVDSAELRLADRYDLLAGPAGVPVAPLIDPVTDAAGV